MDRQRLKKEVRLYTLVANIFLGAMLLGAIPAMVAQINFTAGAVLTLVVMVGAAAFILRPVGGWTWKKKRAPVDTRDWPTQLREMEAAGLVTTTDYRARRAFEVEQIEDEGESYFIELEDERILFLNGQYFYDISSDDAGTRLFPTTDFTVKRHRIQGHVVDLIVRGTVLEPEVVAPAFDDWTEVGVLPGDGAIIETMSYDALKAKRLGQGFKDFNKPTA
jgi:hypothetical protein